jgi:hypothetical protein
VTRRTFVHPIEKRSWSIDVSGSRIRLAMTSDDDPEELVRERSCRSAKEAQAEADALVREQLADGFEEIGAEPLPSFDALARRWADADPSALSSEWLASARGWSAPFAERVLARIAELDGTGREAELVTRDADTWLRMQVPTIVPGLLLALRDPRQRVRENVLWTLRSETRAWDGLPRPPEPHHFAIESAFVSLIASPEQPPLPISHVGVEHLLLSPHGVERLASIAIGSDPERAGRATYALACRLAIASDPAILDALARWIARADVAEPIARPALARILAATGAPHHTTDVAAMRENARVRIERARTAS